MAEGFKIADAFADDPRAGRLALALLAAARSGGADEVHTLLEGLVAEHPDNEMRPITELFTALIRTANALAEAVAGPADADDFIAQSITELALREQLNEGA
ncbi:hypothetical protein ACWDOR_23785 [Streptosporangium canum]